MWLSRGVYFIIIKCYIVSCFYVKVHFFVQEPSYLMPAGLSQGVYVHSYLISSCSAGTGIVSSSDLSDNKAVIINSTWFKFVSQIYGAEM